MLKQKISVCLVFVVSCLICQAQQVSDSINFVDANWIVKPVANGIVLKQFHFTGDRQLFDSHQFISIVEIDTSVASGDFALANDEGKITRTSTFAADSAAIVACNGTFYNMSEPYNCVCYFKKNGIEAFAFTEDMLQRDNGAIAISSNGEIEIYAADPEHPGVVKPQDWAKAIDAPSVMTSGPILMLNGDAAMLEENSFNRNRHPRTAIATKGDKVYLIAVDGRSAEYANGVSLWEFTAMMSYLGVEDALNLDGGGSTTLYVAGEPFNGIVNHPSDNRTFDHAGERYIVNSLLYIPDSK